MKTFKTISIFLIISVMISSCGKLDINPDDDDGGSATTVVGTMKATLDGKAWEAKSVNFGGFFATIKVNGVIDDNNLISLELTDTNLQLNQTYLFDNANLEDNLLATLVVKMGEKTLLSKSGSFKITKYKRNEIIEGEMNATLTNFIDADIELENCKFSMEYK